MEEVRATEPDALDALGIEADVDYRFEYWGYWSWGAVCRVRIFERDGRKTPVVIATELVDENENTSVTNLVEHIAAQVAYENELDFGPEYGSIAPPFVFVEHYPERQPSRGYRDPLFAESFDLVTFASYAIGGAYHGVARQYLRVFGTPEWKRIDRESLLAMVLR